jgi:hypothetical protein
MSLEAKSSGKKRATSASNKRAKSKTRVKKGPSTDKAKAIIELRDALIAKGVDAETVGLSCKGMFKCDKEVDEACLDGIMAKLQALEKSGGGKKRRPRKSRSRSRSRSRSKSKSKTGGNARRKSRSRSRSKSRKRKSK